MDRPYKVIWKYKNDNRYAQYHVYVFVGNLRSNLDSIFKKIEDLNLFETLIELSPNEIKKLDDAYGDDWYKCFFNMYHTAFMISQIDNNASMSKDIKDKFGDEWYDRHIKSHKWADRKLLYSYSALIKDERERKNVKKGRMMAVADDDGNLDYKLRTNINIKTVLSSKITRAAERAKAESESEMESEPDTEIENQSAGHRSQRRNKRERSINHRVKIDTEFGDYPKKLDTDLMSDQDMNNMMGAVTDRSDTSASEYNLVSTDEEAVRMIGGSGSSQGTKINMGFYNWETGEHYALTNETLYGYDFENEIKKLDEKLHGHRGGGDDESEGDDDDLEGAEYEHDIDEVDESAGQSDDDDEDDLAALYDSLDDDDKNVADEDEGEEGSAAADVPPEDDGEFELMKEEELDLDEIEKLYLHDDVEGDSNVSKTSELIKKALADDNLFKKSSKSMVDFDQIKDNSIHSEKLKDVYQKIFVKNQFIFGDDTIKTVKHKLCCSLKSNKKFSNTQYLLPSRQYLWSEYVYDNKVEKVMVGQKWLRRNELLDIDIEPDTRFYLYEQLKDQLGTLRHNIRRYGNKIRREDDENNILYDYEGYLTDGDLFMIDVYNELGAGYSPDNETLKNLQDVYLKIYFPLLRSEDVKNIIDYLNGNTKTENSKLSTTYEVINNDIVMENEIVSLVENVKKNDKIDHIFKVSNYVTQSTLHVNLRFTGKKKKLDLYRIFNEFQTDVTYPYIQYQTIERGAVYKYSEEEINKYVKDKDNFDILYKWFEISPYGINFKVKILDESSGKHKFMSIGLTESGRIEYKTQWQESDKATIEDIRKTYVYVKNLVEKINRESPMNKVVVPEDEEFKYAFINTIQKYEIPGKFIIDHNDLSEFSRYFYPYVALVIEPRKRQAKTPKVNEKSKFGTYLRYKRVHKYENQGRLEQRIIFFLRNYEFQDNKLASELAKQFNITEERSLEAIQKTRTKYPNLKKSRKILKKLENIPKYKAPGIGIDVQGKQRERYKIRISGARNKRQLNRIIQFMNILIFLYVETYLYKKKDKQHLKERLKKLTNIAKRRSKVDVTVSYEKETKTVKQMTQLDRRRIGFKPEKGQNQWTRSCQNSGEDKKRRPQQYTAATIDDLLKRGFVYNATDDVYEKKVKVKAKKGKKGKKSEVVIRTIKLPDYDEAGKNTGSYMHYACDPDENGEHMFIGFLTRSSNPYGHCMPCCFKKDPATSNNKTKRDFFNQCLGKMPEKIEGQEKKVTKSTGDKLYILQDTNKIQEGRFGFLPKYLDRYFNTMLSKEKKIKHHYLEKTETGYFFKYGSIQTEYQFLNAVGATLNMNVTEIKDAIIAALEVDKSDQIFTSLNNGDIKTQFDNRDEFIKFVKDSTHLDYQITKDIICIPGVLTRNGLNLVIFKKREIKTKGVLEKERIIENFFLDCRDSESNYTITDPEYETIFLVRDNKNYYPIVLVDKPDKASKTVGTTKVFQYKNDPENIVDHVSDFYIKNCSSRFIESMSKYANVNAKEASHILRDIGKNYGPRYQIIDIRNKCKYLITNDGLLVPVKPSGCPWDVQIIKGFDKYIQDLDVTYRMLMDIYRKTQKKIPIKPIGVFYESKSGNELKINSVMTKTKGVVPVTPVMISIDELNKMKLIYEKKPLTDKIDKEIMKGNDNYQVDERMARVSESIFEEESYQLFRLEFSNYINKEDNSYQRRRLDKITRTKKITKNQRIDKIRLLIYKIIDTNLHKKYLELVKSRETDQAKADIEDRLSRAKIAKGLGEKYSETHTREDGGIPYEEIIEEIGQGGGGRQLQSARNVTFASDQILSSLATTAGYADPNAMGYDIHYGSVKMFNQTGGGSNSHTNQIGGKINKLIHRISRIPDVVGYQVNNDRKVCEIHEERDECNTNSHCRWAHGSCYMALTTDMIVAFVNRMSEELARNDMKANEIMQEEGYFVSDIVDRNKFTRQIGQKIIRASATSIKRTLKELFGHDNIPNIGKRRAAKIVDVNYHDLNAKFPLLDLKAILVQRVIENNISIFRAYSNGYYWLINSFYDKETRNLGYYSPLQSDLANRFKAAVIDWLSDPNKQHKISPEMLENMGSRGESQTQILDFVNRLSNEIETISTGVTELLVLSKVNHTVPIIVRTDTYKVMHIFENGRHIFEPSDEVQAKYDFTKTINIKFEYVGNSMSPDIIDVVYHKKDEKDEKDEKDKKDQKDLSSDVKK
jgi:hypothetical protein